MPALPLAWKTGYIHGLMARDGFEVYIDREDGKLKQARILSKLGNPLRVNYMGEIVNFKVTEMGKLYTFGKDSSGLIIK